MPKRRKEAARPSLSSLGLIAVEIKLNDVAKLDESELYYSISVTRPEPGPEDNLYFICRLECGKQVADGEGPVISVEARYGCILEAPKGYDATEVAKTIARYSVWAKFSDIFMLITSQMGIDFPPLPTEPRGIDMTKLTIQDSEAGLKGQD